MSQKKIKTMMLIDDNQIDQMLHERIVERSGLVETVISFLYADEALEYLKVDQQPRPDVILLDINMPRMDGFEFLEAVNLLPSELKSMIVVMLTTSLDARDKKRADNFDLVKGFMNKPLSQERIEEIVLI